VEDGVQEGQQHGQEEQKAEGSVRQRREGKLCRHHAAALHPGQVQHSHSAVSDTLVQPTHKVCTMRRVH
jgi:hypothetical protein